MFDSELIGGVFNIRALSTFGVRGGDRAGRKKLRQQASAPFSSEIFAFPTCHLVRKLTGFGHPTSAHRKPFD
jgi:hypothetical protein